MNNIKVGVVGGAGYTAGELLRILINHPRVEISFIQSESQAGKPVHSVHQDMFHTSGLLFSREISPEADVYFLCKGHGESAKILESHSVPRDKYIIDLSQDFRITGSEEGIQSHYGEFIYGLPELYRDRIRNAKNVANPGCFATCIQLGLLPLAEKHLLTDDVHVSAVTGSTGAGQSLSSTSHFTWRENNLSVYKAFNHQHLKEIRQSLTGLQENMSSRIFFIPYRGNFTRGIIATLYLKSDLEQQEVRDFYDEYYRDHPYVCISGTNINLKQVINTNYCLLYIEKIEDRLMIISIIDNLLKGASGQAVQNMNLMTGIDEMTGLYLKGSAF
jgi:N-acetyl-gamma-glutamyl-phosphate reductase